MSLTLDINQLRTDLRGICGTTATSSGFDNDSVDLMLNRSLWAIMNRFPFRETETTKFFQTVVGTPKYQTPTLFEAIRQMSIEDLDSGAHSILNPMTELEYESQFINDTTAYDTPTNYVRFGPCIKLFPTPDDIYTITIKHTITLMDMDDGNASFPLPKNWYEIVLYGGIYRGFYALRQADNAVKYKTQQDSWIAEAQPIESKEEMDRHTAGVKVRGYEQDTIYGPS